MRLSRYLGIDIEDAAFALALDVTHGIETGAVKIARKLGVLYKCAASDEVFEAVFGDKVVVLAIDFARAGEAGGVYKENGSGTVCREGQV